MLRAMKTEILLRKDELQNKNLKSLYFGGGTPSILTKAQLEKIFRMIRDSYLIKENVEITLEANPDDLDKDFLKGLSNSPVNRLSIGTQSFFEADLRLMNRCGTSRTATVCSSV